MKQAEIFSFNEVQQSVFNRCIKQLDALKEEYAIIANGEIFGTLEVKEKSKRTINY
jgi:hypothetical protein